MTQQLASVAPALSPVWLAIAAAALAAGLYAQGARVQHRAVRSALGGEQPTVPPAALRRLLGNPGWLAGLVLLGVATGLHVAALAMAPLTVVQPVGVLAIVAVVALDSRASRRAPDRASIMAMLSCTAGVGLFVLIAANGTNPSIGVDAAADATRVIGLLGAVVLVIGLAGSLAGRPARRLVWTVGAGVSFGFAAALTRIVAGQLAGEGLAGVPLVAVFGLVAAGLLGGWCVQQAYGSGPPELVVAGLTVIDPIVAVGIGLAVLGEGAGLGAGSAAAMVGCAGCALAGVVLLARRRLPDLPRQTDRERATAGGVLL